MQIRKIIYFISGLFILFVVAYLFWSWAPNCFPNKYDDIFVGWKESDFGDNFLQLNEDEVLLVKVGAGFGDNQDMICYLIKIDEVNNEAANQFDIEYEYISVGAKGDKLPFCGKGRLQGRVWVNRRFCFDRNPIVYMSSKDSNKKKSVIELMGTDLNLAWHSGTFGINGPSGGEIEVAKSSLNIFDEANINDKILNGFPFFVWKATSNNKTNITRMPYSPDKRDSNKEEEGGSPRDNPMGHATYFKKKMTGAEPTSAIRSGINNK